MKTFKTKIRRNAVIWGLGRVCVCVNGLQLDLFSGPQWNIN